MTGTILFTGFAVAFTVVTVGLFTGTEESWVVRRARNLPSVPPALWPFGIRMWTGLPRYYALVCMEMWAVDGLSACIYFARHLIVVALLLWILYTGAGALIAVTISFHNRPRWLIPPPLRPQSGVDRSA